MANIELRERTHEGTENGSETPLLPSTSVLPSSDYVLVGKRFDKESETFKKQEDFIKELKKKNFKINTIEDVAKDKVFHGIRAPMKIFDKYKYLLKVSDACNWSCEQNDAVPLSTRIRIVHFILNNTCISSGENLKDLTTKKVFETSFCLHEKKEQKSLRESWARWTACFQGQPIGHVRKYFGEKVALYYLWLGWYTFLLIPPAILGLIVFLYGMAFFNTSPLIKEVCEANTIMCPMCDKICKVWQLSDTCLYAKVNLLFDNEGTVAFAMFMAVWATVFLEFWKRHRALYVCKWKVDDWCEDEEELILDIVNDPDCKPKEYSHSYLHSTLVLILVTLMLVLIIGLTQALVVFRVVATVLLSEGKWQFLSEHANMVAVMLGAVLHYLTITIMTRVNRKVALKLCDIEKTRSLAATERSFTVKMFTFQFFTLFSSLIYVAFFLGRINGHPGGYVRIAGKWRLEECHPSGCLTDLFIQMAVIMLLKQTINNVFEFLVPWFCSWRKKKNIKKNLRSMCGHFNRKESKGTEEGSEQYEKSNMQNWQRNYSLKEVNAFSLFNEFLEMVIQFSFTTIFVAAFPLAPLLALINNIFEIRLDAIKMVSLERRLVPKKTNDIGVWTRVLEMIGVLAVIANGLVIGISSDFIPRLVYRYRYGPCAKDLATDLELVVAFFDNTKQLYCVLGGGGQSICMTGYINNTLSTVRVADKHVSTDFVPVQLVTHSGLNVTHCSYKDYRSMEDNGLTAQFWLILAVRFAFVILFEHVVVICKFIAAWFVPDCPLKVKNDRLQDKLTRLKEELRERSNRFDRSTDV
ncbi:hypothetical protein SKAU_G00412060 [Synaphobranchus kaupii]|uniref:Anoctamin n=1 Tax=Synaphobranchus kaupii TaxID=118154 RepID=A0A9Q1IBS5_SYNKA|nr:hypothetical protein SKAU_G00412060 [Synaphobranchus kaupii]